MTANRQISKILVIKLRNIGDVLLSAPLFANLKAAYPGAQITALVNAGTEAMLSDNPDIDQLLVYDRGLKKEPFLKRLGGELGFYRRVRREGFDLVLNLTEGDRGALIALVSGARIRVGLDPLGKGMIGKRRIYTHMLPRTNWTDHAVTKNLEFLAPLGLATVSHRVSFHFSEQDRQLVAARLAADGLAPGGYFHAHVTSRWMFKALPPTKAAFLVDRLALLTGLPAVLTCAPDRKELDYLARVMALLTTPHRDWSGAVTLKQLGALSAAARFFVGVDSAPMHMAAALDIPVLGVFGPSLAQEWGPWDNSLSANPYTARNGIQLTGRHLVLQSGRDCVPCHRDGCNGSKVSDCLDFSEAELTAVAAQFLAQLQRSRGGGRTA
jgi:heptosyltransferase-3